MRFDLHKVRTYLVNEFNEATDTVARIEHDGSDLILLDLYTGESVIIHLVDRMMPINEIRDTLDENTAARRHTLFILWSDMLLPYENQTHIPEDWMEVLMTLYNGRIYGYDSYGPYASVFPAVFEKKYIRGPEFYVTYGNAIKASNLHCDTVHLDNRYLKGTWRIADFSPPRHDQQRQHNGQQKAPLHTQRNTMAAYYAVLEVPLTADRGAIRRAYYELARRYHPDINNSPDSTLRMQQINEAYKRILEQLEKDT